MDWIAEHRAALAALLTFLTGVGSEARWRALSRFFRWTVNTGNCEAQKLRCEMNAAAREQETKAIVTVIREELSIVREEMTMAQARVRALTVEVASLREHCGASSADSSPAAPTAPATTTPMVS